MSKIPKLAACTQRFYEIEPRDLPLSCPLPEMKIWNAHPRVFLPIEATGRARCPYCSTEYVLKNAE